MVPDAHVGAHPNADTRKWHGLDTFFSLTVMNADREHSAERRVLHAGSLFLRQVACYADLTTVSLAK